MSEPIVIFDRAYNPTTCIILPPPELGDGVAYDMSTIKLNTIDGDTYVYNRGSGDFKIHYEFKNIGLEKLKEIATFFELYMHNDLWLLTYDNDMWVVKIETSVIDWIASRIAQTDCEKYFGDFVLDFIGRKYKDAN